MQAARCPAFMRVSSLVHGSDTFALPGRGESCHGRDAMPVTPHLERHFTATDTVRDVVIGMADGLTVPFALAAGLAGAIDSTGVIVTAGLAEIAAGAIAMGLGGYQAARTDAEHYENELAREERETREVPRVEIEEVASVFRRYGLSDDEIWPILKTIPADRRRWVDFMKRFEAE